MQESKDRFCDNRRTSPLFFLSRGEVPELGGRSVMSKTKRKFWKLLQVDSIIFGKFLFLTQSRRDAEFYMLTDFLIYVCFWFCPVRYGTMLPLPAPQTELAVTSCGAGWVWALEREPFLLVWRASLGLDHSVLFEYRLVCGFLEFLSEQKRV